jgi:N-acetylglucosaminyl-diphospho-decaprenol L-rhamnosyltransferase
MKLLVVIVNYRTADLTIDCLVSLRDEMAAIAGSQVVVVDSASGDGSVEKICAAIAESEWGGWVEVRGLDINGGFPKGNNAAIRAALDGQDPPDFVLLLNPDTVVRPGAVRVLLEFMIAQSRAGIAGSRLEDPDGTPQRSAFRFPTVLSELEAGTRIGLVSRVLHRRIVAPPAPCEACPTEWVAGAIGGVGMLVCAAIAGSASGGAEFGRN